MSVAQRVIKYCAMAFGFFITFIIISAIVGAILGIFGVTEYMSGSKTEFVNDYSKDFSEYSNITDLSVDVGIANLNIYEGNAFKVEAQNMSSEFECKVENGILSIKDNSSKKFNFDIFDWDNHSIINLYIPSGYLLNKATIQTGIGQVEIKSITTHRFDLSTGVGKVKIDELISTDYTKINNGIGELNIENANVKDLTIENGIGKTTIEGKILGDSLVKGGVGEINLKVVGNSNDYEVTKENGIGSIDVNYNGKKASTLDQKYKLNVEGGVGAIKINFVD